MSPSPSPALSLEARRALLDRVFAVLLAPPPADEDPPAPNDDPAITPAEADANAAA